MIHLITGNTGAGKTTYAHALKKSEGGLVFSIDHWNATLFLDDKKEEDGIGWFLERIVRCDTMIQSIVLQLEKASTNAILDLGFAKRERRNAFYAFAKTHKIPYTLHFLDTDKATRRSRVKNRNLKRGNTFQFEVSDQDFEFMETWFEPLTDIELQKAIRVEL